MPRDKAQPRKLAVIYARYSSHTQRDVSIEQQVRVDQEFAERQELQIIGVYADRALTGTNDNRPEFQRMVNDAKKGAFDYVIVYSLDRFARDRYDSVVYKRILKDNGVKVLSAMENISDDPTGVLLESMLEGLAEYYSRELSAKIRRGLTDNARKCMVVTNVPFGYTKGPDGKHAIVPEEAAIVREIFRRVLDGEQIIAIARDLNKRGIRTKRGREWGRTSFETMLSNEKYAGYYICGDMRVAGGIPAIVDEETFRAVQEYLKRKKNPRNAPIGKRRENSVYLLTGKAYCGECKAPMIGRSGTSRNGQLHAYYVCKQRDTEHACRKEHIARERAEYMVARALKEYVLQDGMIEWLADKTVEYQEKHAEPVELQLLRKELKQVEAGIANLVRAIEQGIITSSTKERLEELEAQRSELTGKIALATKNSLLDSIPREMIVAALSLVRAGDLEDKRYQELLFDMFLRRVYFYDDHMKLVFNYTPDGCDNTDIPFDIDDTQEQADTSVRADSGMLHHSFAGRTPTIYMVSGLFVLEVAYADLR